MNLTIDELERRLYIEGRLSERAALLEFEAAWDGALDLRGYEADYSDVTPEFVCFVAYVSRRPML